MKRSREKTNTVEHPYYRKPIMTNETEKSDEDMFSFCESLDSYSSEESFKKNKTSNNCQIEKPIMIDKEKEQENEKMFLDACRSGHTDIVELLLDDGISVNFERALTVSCLENHIEIIDLLLYHKNTQSFGFVHNYAATAVAIWNDNLEVATELLSRNSYEVNNILSDAFVSACGAGNFKTISGLMNQFPEIIPNTRQGLLKAVECNQPAVVNLLCDYIKTKPADIKDAFLLATQKGFVEITSFLTSFLHVCFEDHQALANACALNNKMLTRMLCRRCFCKGDNIDFTKIMINIVETDNSYALGQLYRKFQAKLEFKKVSVRNKRLLHFAVSKKALKCAKLLIRFEGFDLKTYYMNADEPHKVFHFFCEVDDLESVKFLMAKREIDPSYSDQLAVYIAIRKNSFAVLEELLKDERISLSIFYGKALSLAMQCGSIECILLLLDDDHVDPNVENCKIIAWACRTESSRVLAKLMVHPKVNNDTILYRAAALGKTMLVQTLINQKNQTRFEDEYEDDSSIEL